MRRAPSLALLLTLAACSPTWTQGKRLADAGRFEEATSFWLDALDQDLDAAAPRRGLERYGPDVVRVHVDRAREHEAERRYPAALEALQAALSFAEVLDGVGVDPGLNREELAAEAAEIEQAHVAYQIEQGQRAAQEGRHADAVRWFEQVLALRPEQPEVMAGLAAAYLAWGHADREAHRYVEAVEHLEQAHRWGAGHEAVAWRDAIRVALGRYWLRAGACRDAVEVLEAAITAGGAPAPRLDEDLALAEDCARVELVVRPFERAVGGDFAGTDLGALATDRLAEALRERGSDYLALVDPARAADVESRRGRRYELGGRVSQLHLDRGNPVSEVRELRGTRKVECPDPDGYASYRPELCDEPVPLRVELSTRAVALNLAGSIRATDARTAEVALTRSLDVRAAHESRARGPFLGADGAEVAVGAEASERVVAVDPELLALPTEAPALPRDPELLAEAARLLAEAAADAVLAEVDQRGAAPSPARLDIAAPMLDPEEIEFAQPPAGGEAPSRVVLPTP